MPLPILAAAAIGTGLLKSGFGIGQLLGASKAEERNKRPAYEIQDEYYQNRNLAASMAQGGLSDAALSFYGDQADRGLQAGIDATLQGGGGINAVGSLMDQYNQSVYGVAAKDSELATGNRRYFIDRNADLAAQETMKWTIDKYEPYKDKARAIAQQRTAGTQNLFGGLQEATAAGIAASQAGNNKDLLDVGGTDSGATGPTGRANTYITPSITSGPVNPAMPSSIPKSASAFNLYSQGRQLSPAELDLWYRQQATNYKDANLYD